MTEIDPMQEMEIVHDYLILVARKTKASFDNRMRVTVKELLNDRYPGKAENVEAARYREEFRQTMESAENLADALFGVDSGKRRLYIGNIQEWNRTRPSRICQYVQKLVDIFPAERLTHLLISSQHLTAEELIEFYEANKGEGKQSDYSGQPTGIDPNAFRIIATRIRRKQGNY